MSKSLPTVHYGPEVTIDQHIGDTNHPGRVDLMKLGDNLQNDFPELTQSDWDKVLIHFTDVFEPHIGGAAINLSPLRNFRSMRFLQHYKRLVGHLLDVPQPPSIRTIEQMSDGHDIVVCINMGTNIRSNAQHGFSGLHDNMTHDFILAHELHHAAGHLFQNQLFFNPQEKEIRKYSARIAKHVGMISTGLGMSGIGAADTFWQLTDAKLPVAGAALVLGGLVAAGAPIMYNEKFQHLDPERFDIKPVELPFGSGELCSDAYAFATADKWEGVIENNTIMASSSK